MQPDAPTDLLAVAARWQRLPAWDRTELGRSLRRLGWTYGEIRELIPVPKGTLAGWCRDITLSQDQVAAIKARTASRRDVPRDTQRKRRDRADPRGRARVLQAITCRIRCSWPARCSTGAKAPRPIVF